MNGSSGIAMSRPFCDDSLWDWNRTWYAEQPEFTHCFQSTVLVYVPVIILTLFLPFNVWSRGQDGPRQENQAGTSSLIIARVVVNGLLIAICMAQYVLNKSYLSFITMAKDLAPWVFIVTFALATLLELKTIKTGVKSLTTLFWVFLSLVITQTCTLASYVQFPQDYLVEERIVFFVYYGMLIIQLFLTSWSTPRLSAVRLEGNYIYHTNADKGFWVRVSLT